MAPQLSTVVFASGAPIGAQLAEEYSPASLINVVRVAARSPALRDENARLLLPGDVVVAVGYKNPNMGSWSWESVVGQPLRKVFDTILEARGMGDDYGLKLSRPASDSSVSSSPPPQEKEKEDDDNNIGEQLSSSSVRVGAAFQVTSLPPLESEAGRAAYREAIEEEIVYSPPPGEEALASLERSLKVTQRLIGKNEHDVEELLAHIYATSSTTTTKPGIVPLAHDDDGDVEESDRLFKWAQDVKRARMQNFHWSEAEQTGFLEAITNVGSRDFSGICATYNRSLPPGAKRRTTSEMVAYYYTHFKHSARYVRWRNEARARRKAAMSLFARCRGCGESDPSGKELLVCRRCGVSHHPECLSTPLWYRWTPEIAEAGENDEGYTCQECRQASRDAGTEAQEKINGNKINNNNKSAASKSSTSSATNSQLGVFVPPFTPWQTAMCETMTKMAEEERARQMRRQATAAPATATSSSSTTIPVAAQAAAPHHRAPSSSSSSSSTSSSHELMAPPVVYTRKRTGPPPLPAPPGKRHTLSDPNFYLAGLIITPEALRESAMVLGGIARIRELKLWQYVIEELGLPPDYAQQSIKKTYEMFEAEYGSV